MYQSLSEPLSFQLACTQGNHSVSLFFSLDIFLYNGCCEKDLDIIEEASNVIPFLPPFSHFPHLPASLGFLSDYISPRKTQGSRHLFNCPLSLWNKLHTIYTVF